MDDFQKPNAAPAEAGSGKPEPTDEAIRRKLVALGPAALSDAELLSIVVRDGGKGRTAFRLSADLLEHHGHSLIRLGGAELSSLRMFGGMGLARAAVVAAAMELGKRRKTEEAMEIERIDSKEDALRIFKPLIAELPYEEFWAVYLSASNRILDRIKISQGGVSGTVVDNRLIIKRALDRLASSILLVHNHPSGDPTPNRTDKALTDKIRESAELFGIRLTDHLIVTAGECFSFCAAGLLP